MEFQGSYWLFCDAPLVGHGFKNIQKSREKVGSINKSLRSQTKVVELAPLPSSLVLFHQFVHDAKFYIILFDLTNQMLKCQNIY